MDGSDLWLLRQRLGKTQAALAQDLDVSTNTVARWERNELRIVPSVIQRLYDMALTEASGSAITPPKGLIRDPHHKAILEGLQARLDPVTFETCTADLLRDDGWRVVPVAGGKDEGFDGTIADEFGDPFPLVVTTSERLVRNLENSLTSVQKGIWISRKAIFATSRSITQGMRRKLHGAANELGFTLVQTYGQDWFANRLYHRPDWCKTLLGITGRPQALSVYPRTKRPLLGESVLSREADLQWLMSRNRDCLLVGAPGSGKTFLLRSLALQGDALFLVDEDRDQIANDIRRLQPLSVIIDDAHVNPEVIGDFALIRRQIGAEHIRIIATSWLGEEQGVRAALHATEEDVRKLRPIDADTMIEVLKGVGLAGPDELLSLIRHQANGRPGLGVTLAHLCLMGDIQRVASGEAMLEQVLASADRIIDRESKTLLAPFALAGDSGADLNSVADFLKTPVPQIKRLLASLAAGGIVRPRSNATRLGGPAPVSVEPPEMRWVIVRDEFFGGTASLAYQPLLSVAENKHDIFMTLIGAKSRGADVPGLLDHLEEAQAPHLWSAYANVGPAEARQAIERHPELIVECAQAALLYMPDETVPKLLDHVGGRSEPADFQFDRAMKEISEWGIRLDPDLESEEASGRRQCLVRATGRWWQRTSMDVTAVRVMCNALSPQIDFASPDPGAGNKVNVYYGIYPLPMLEGMTELWPDVLEVVAAGSEVPWNDLLGMVSSWRYGDPGIDLPEKTENFMRSFADRMLLDLVEVSREHPGVQHRLRDEIQRSSLDAQLHLDLDFELAYPERNSFTSDENRRLAGELATGLSGRSAEVLAGSLARVEREARYAGLGGPNSILAAACSLLAGNVTDPMEIVDSLVENEISAEAVEAFLDRASALKAPGWDSCLSRLLDNDRYKEMAVSVIVRNPAPPAVLLRGVISKVPEMPTIVREWCARGGVADRTLATLLCHEDDMVALSAAIGHWCADPRGTVAGQHRESWRGAVLRPIEYPDHYRDLGEILSRDGELATDWVVSVLRREAPPGLGLQWEETLSKAIQAMTSRQRRRVMEALPVGRSHPLHHVAGLLTAGNLDLYRELLSSAELKAYHLSPLPGSPDQAWLAMARLAWEAGYSVEEIAGATVSPPRRWRGSRSGMWGRLRSYFEAMFDCDDPIGPIARIAAEMVTQRENYYTVLEEEEAVRGW